MRSWCFKDAEYCVVTMVSSSSVIGLHNPLSMWDPCEFPRRLSVVTRDVTSLAPHDTAGH